VDQNLQPISTPVDAAAQIAGALRKPDGIDEDHRPSSRSNAASSRVWLSGEYSLRPATAPVAVT
jgi:hypothetical protein